MQKKLKKAVKNELKIAKLEAKISKLQSQLSELTENEQKEVAKIKAKPRHLDKISVPKYSLAEELINSISHGIAAGLAVAALVICLLKTETTISVVSVSLYGAFMIVLYIISCIYHALSPRIIGKKVMRILDHVNVMLMVAGTYTPICLSLIGGALGWVVFGIVWAITILAVVLNSINVDKYSKISVACNLILGWGIVSLLPILIDKAPLSGILIYLVGGGAVYSIGSVLYVIGAKKKYMHSIFHFFVIAASILHFFFIYLYCI